MGCKMEEEPRQIRDIINLLHMLGFLSWEGGGRVGVKEEENENKDNNTMTNDKPKSEAASNGGCRG